MMRRERGRVHIDASEDQFQGLQVVMGYAMASALQRSDGVAEDRDVQMVLRTINVLHEGDDTFTPYEVLEK
jgi:hypothetical protein